MSGLLAEAKARTRPVQLTSRPHYSAALNNLLEAALAYAKRGWNVFPCTADKKPATQGGFKDATSDEMFIRRWWKGNPRANIGIAARASGLVVIDVDEYKEDCDSTRLADLPATYVVQTASGGKHYYLSLSPSVQLNGGVNKLGRRVDVPNYVLAPPSVFEGHPYTLLHDRPLAELPPALLAALSASKGTASTSSATSASSHGSLASATQQLHSLPLSVKSLGEAVALSLPTGPRENDKCLFLLARALLTLRASGPLTVEAEMEAFEDWHRKAGQLGFLRERREAYLEKFLHACANAKQPLGCGLSEAWAATQTTPPPMQEVARVAAFKSEGITRLLALCWHLSLLSGGGVFFLACGSAAPLLGCSAMTASTWLKTLVRVGVLKVAEPGTTTRATRYTYVVALNSARGEAE